MASSYISVAFVEVSVKLTSTQCDFGWVGVPIELLSTYCNLPQPSVVLVQCVQARITFIIDSDII